jgi:AraC-like DNA-binding protein
MDPGTTLELLLRGAAAGSQIGVGLALARSASNPSLRLATVLFIAANTAFLLNGAAAISAAIGPLTHVLWLVQIGGAGFLWLFVVTLFEDARIDFAGLAPAAGLTVIGVLAQIMSGTAAAPLWLAHNVIGLVLAAHTVIIILRSGRDDLVEERRRLRVPVMAVIGLYSILLSLAQIGQGLGFDSPWYSTVDAAAQALFGVLGIVALLRARDSLFGRAANPALAAESDPDAAWLPRLHAAMREGVLWQKEGLTIAELAETIGLPEHRLRRLINQTLGHRNFPSFVNQHRIEAAKAVLADPGNARRTVASIAFDLGFASLGPFNRAFREATGLTPTDYRRQILAETSPILEKAG